MSTFVFVLNFAFQFDFFVTSKSKMASKTSSCIRKLIIQQAAFLRVGDDSDMLMSNRDLAEVFFYLCERFPLG